MSTRNRFFTKYGHECHMPVPIEDLYMFQPNTNIFTQIWHKIIKWRMACETNNRTINFMRSQKRVYMEHQRHLQHIYIIHPFSSFRHLWESLMMIIFFFLFIMIPMELCLYHTHVTYKLSITWRAAHLLFDLTCIMDIFISFFTGYCDYDKNLIVLEPKTIAVHYLFTYCVPDILSSIPMSFADHYWNYRIVVFVNMLKLFRFVSFFRYVKNFTETQRIYHSTFKIVMIILCLIIYYHLVCCLTIFMSVKNKVYLENTDNLRDSLLLTYIFALYRTCLLINNVSYLDFGDTGIRMYCMVIWFCSKIAYMFILAFIIDIITAKSSSGGKYNEMVAELKAYMSHNQLPEYLQRRLLCYYEFRFQKSYFRESEILSTISGHLRQDITMHCCRKLVENVKFFEGLPLSLIIRIVSSMNVEIYLTNDVVIKYGSEGDSMYFIASGTVAVYSQFGFEICHLSDGECFGEVALVIKREKRIASIVAVETCELYRLVQHDFARAILPYPDLLRKIERTAFNRLETLNLVS